MASLVTKFSTLLDLLIESTYSVQPLNFTDIHSFYMFSRSLLTKVEFF